MSLKIRTYSELEGGSSDLGDQVGRQQERVDERLASVGSIIGVMSGKGGVGKSLVTAALASALAERGVRVAVIDGDLNGPSLVRMLGVTPGGLTPTADAIRPARSTAGIDVMSMALLVEDDAALDWNDPAPDSFVWRGTQERGALREFLADVVWGSPEVMLVDLPPGIHRLVELHELAPALAGVVAVTIPSAASRDAVARSLELCKRREIRVLGLVENMAGYRCAACGEIGPLHPGSAADDLSAKFGVEVTARFPLDQALGDAAERGGLTAWLGDGSDTAAAVRALATDLTRSLETSRGGGGDE